MEINFMAEYGGAEFDRRQYPRLDCMLPFAFEFSEQKLPDGVTANISLGGLLVFMPQVVSQGAVLELAMRLPGEEAELPFKTRAEVMWVSTEEIPEGWACQAGLRFFEMAPRYFNAWKAFLDTWYNK